VVGVEVEVGQVVVGTPDKDTRPVEGGRGVARDGPSAGELGDVPLLPLAVGVDSSSGRGGVRATQEDASTDGLTWRVATTQPPACSVMSDWTHSSWSFRKKLGEVVVGAPQVDHPAVDRRRRTSDHPSSQILDLPLVVVVAVEVRQMAVGTANEDPLAIGSQARGSSLTSQVAGAVGTGPSAPTGTGG